MIMINSEIIKQDVHKKYKYRLFRRLIFINVFAVFSIFISLSSTGLSEREKKTIEINKELAFQNDSLKRFISNELIQIKKMENELFRKTFRLSTSVDLTDSIINANPLFGFHEDQVDFFNKISKMAITKWDSIYYMPLGSPVSSADYIRISDNFGYRMHPILKEVLFHDGIDISAPIGADVFTTGNGIVQNTFISDIGYGNRVVINHGNGYMTVYAHLDEILVEEGVYVNKGDVIGKVGNTGRSTGPHLHYEVLVNNRPVNPLNYMYSRNMLANR